MDGFDLFVKNNSFKVNHDKTKVIMFNPSYKYTFPPELFVGQKPYLEVVRATKMLGLVLSDYLKWIRNTDLIISKAMKRKWTLKR